VAKLTVKRLHQECKSLFLQEDTRLVEKPLEGYQAQAVWDHTISPPKDLQIYIDTDQNGSIPLVLHELIHVTLWEITKLADYIVYDLEEEMVEALTISLWRYVQKDSRRRAWWREAIAEKTR